MIIISVPNKHLRFVRKVILFFIFPLHYTSVWAWFSLHPSQQVSYNVNTYYTQKRGAYIAISLLDMVHNHFHDINEVKKMVLIGADCESSFDQVKEKHSGLICVCQEKKNHFLLNEAVGT